MPHAQQHDSAARPYDVSTILSSGSSSGNIGCRTCCSCCCCSSGRCCDARASTTECPLPAGTPLLLEETWDLVAAAAATDQQQLQQQELALCVVRVAGISYGACEGLEILRGAEDPRRFLLVDTTTLHRQPQLERCGPYQFVGVLSLLLLQQQQLQRVAAALEPSASQQTKVLAAAATAGAPSAATAFVPLVRARLFRRVDGFDFAQYKLALRLLRAVEPQTEPAAAAAAAAAAAEEVQQTQVLLQ
ncbi:hypothetical protein ACSSS7_000352 [Eimeria intestinalis]